GDSLSKHDEAFLRDLEDDRGLFTQLGATFSGPLKYWTATVFVFTFVIFAISVWCGVNAFGAETVKETVLWAGFAIAGVNGIGLLKMWLFMRMNHLATLREIKRVELQVARLKEN
ncbi:MAG: DUF6768 family protein, partial [Henriciella sp.]|uniref:DUF6768 family protein n=1 Tax=Henriciella sp. TaxID=1968823 RepID=UPI003C7261AE